MAPRLTGGDGEHQFSAFAYYRPWTIANRRTPLGKTRAAGGTLNGSRCTARWTGIPTGMAMEADWVMGACMLARRRRLARWGRGRRLLHVLRRRGLVPSLLAVRLEGALSSHGIVHARLGSRLQKRGRGAVFTNPLTWHNITSAVKFFRKHGVYTRRPMAEAHAEFRAGRWQHDVHLDFAPRRCARGHRIRARAHERQRSDFGLHSPRKGMWRAGSAGTWPERWLDLAYSLDRLAVAGAPAVPKPWRRRRAEVAPVGMARHPAPAGLAGAPGTSPQHGTKHIAALAARAPGRKMFSGVIWATDEVGAPQSAGRTDAAPAARLGGHGWPVGSLQSPARPPSRVAWR